LKLIVKVTQIYCNQGVYLRNAILVMEIFCYRYATVNNSTQKQYCLMKLGDRILNLLRMKCTKIYTHGFIQIWYFYCTMSVSV